MSIEPPSHRPSFQPTGWSEDAIVAAARDAGIDLPMACLAGVRTNLALLEDRWATVAVALAQIDAEPSA